MSLSLERILSASKRCRIISGSSDVFSPISLIHRCKGFALEIDKPSVFSIEKGESIKLELITGRELFPCVGKVITLGERNMAVELKSFTRYSSDDGSLPLFLTCFYTKWGSHLERERGIVTHLSPEKLSLSCRIEIIPGQLLRLEEIKLTEKENISNINCRVMRWKPRSNDEDYDEIHLKFLNLKSAQEEAIIKTIFELRKNN